MLLLPFLDRGQTTQRSEISSIRPSARDHPRSPVLFCWEQDRPSGRSHRLFGTRKNPSVGEAFRPHRARPSTRQKFADGKIPADLKKEAIRNTLDPCWNFLQDTPSTRRSLSTWDSMVARTPELMASLERHHLERHALPRSRTEEKCTEVPRRVLLYWIESTASMNRRPTDWMASPDLSSSPSSRLRLRMRVSTTRCTPSIPDTDCSEPSANPIPSPVR